MYVVSMLVVAVCNRISSHLVRKQSLRGEAVYLFFSAAGVLLAASGLLSQLGLEWYTKAPLLMLLPIAYVIGSRMWRGQTIERPLYWIGHTTTALIMLHVFGTAFENLSTNLRPLQGEIANLYLGLVFAEAALFYVLAGLFRNRGNNAYLAAIAACGAVWQWSAYAGIPGAYHSVVYAVLGVVSLGIARKLGIEQKTVFKSDGEKSLAIRGRGLTAFQSGNAIFLITILSTFWLGIARLVVGGNSWEHHGILLLTTLLSGVAVMIVPKSAWRRIYGFAGFALAGLTVVSIAIDWLRALSMGERVKLITVVAGIVVLVASHIARFREEKEDKNDMVDVGQLFGSILATLPLLIAVIYHRGWGEAISVRDEIALIGVTVMMLVTGISWQTKAPTLFASFGLLGYLVLLIVELARHAKQMLSMGIFLSIIGGVLFLLAIGLSMYRERILALPEKITNREGIFQVVSWR